MVGVTFESIKNGSNVVKVKDPNELRELVFLKILSNHCSNLFWWENILESFLHKRLIVEILTIILF